MGNEECNAKDSVGCVATHAVSVVQMAEMDATQKRVWEVERGGRGEEQQYTLKHTHSQELSLDCC